MRRCSLANALERGEHVGMLVDQHFVKGVDVVFFGRWAKANPLIAQLARHTECAIRGVRVVRRPDGNSFWGELTDEIAPARDAEGKIDIQGTMQVITGIVEAGCASIRNNGSGCIGDGGKSIVGWTRTAMYALG